MRQETKSPFFFFCLQRLIILTFFISLFSGLLLTQANLKTNPKPNTEHTTTTNKALNLIIGITLLSTCQYSWQKNNISNTPIDTPLHNNTFTDKYLSGSQLAKSFTKRGIFWGMNTCRRCVCEGEVRIRFSNISKISEEMILCLKIYDSQQFRAKKTQQRIFVQYYALL